MSSFRTDLIVGGSFTAAGGIPAGNIAGRGTAILGARLAMGIGSPGYTHRTLHH
jgi:hypothetical protein